MKVSRGCRSTRKIASTARRATSRTRPRTSTGSLPKAAEARITRTCRYFAAVALTQRGLPLWLSPAKRGPIPSDPARAYVEARGAALSGDRARSAALLAALSADPAAGPGRPCPQGADGRARHRPDGPRTCLVARRMPAGKLPTEARLLLVADEVRHRRILDRAIGWLRACRARAPILDLSRATAPPPGTMPQRGDARPCSLSTIDQIPNQQPAVAAAFRGAGADPAQVPADCGCRAVRAARRSGRRARARIGCGWRWPMASLPLATQRPGR